MANYYFRSIASGEKIVARTLKEINAKARREADKFGQAVQVFVDKAERGVGMKSHRQVSMARNPVADRFGNKYVVQFNSADKYAQWSGPAEDHFASKQEATKYAKWLREQGHLKVRVKGLTRTMARNPDAGSYTDAYGYIARDRVAASDRSRARKPKRLAAHARRGWLGGKEKAASKPTEYRVVMPQLKVHEIAHSLAEAEAIARSYAKQGFKAEVHSD